MSTRDKTTAKAKDPAGCELSASAGWALYRPDGTMMHIYGRGEMSPEREASILSRAWEEICPPDYEAAGTPLPRATHEARRLGYRVVAVTITPNVMITNSRANND